MSLLLKVSSALLFKMSAVRREQIEMLSIDDVAYTIHWREFAADLLGGWREASYLVCCVAVAPRTRRIPGY